MRSGVEVPDRPYHDINREAKVSERFVAGAASQKWRGCVVGDNDEQVVVAVSSGVPASCRSEQVDAVWGVDLGETLGNGREGRICGECGKITAADRVAAALAPRRQCSALDALENRLSAYAEKRCGFGRCDGLSAHMTTLPARLSKPQQWVVRILRIRPHC